MRKQQMTVEEIMEQLRNKDIYTVQETAYAIIETNGTLSVLLKPEYQNSTKSDVKVKIRDDSFTCPVIIDGVIINKNLTALNLNKEDIEKILEKKNVHKKNIFLMNIDTDNNTEIILKE